MTRASETSDHTRKGPHASRRQLRFGSWGCRKSYATATRVLHWAAPGAFASGDFAPDFDSEEMSDPDQTRVPWAQYEAGQEVLAGQPSFWSSIVLERSSSARMPAWIPARFPPASGVSPQTDRSNPGTWLAAEANPGTITELCSPPHLPPRGNEIVLRLPCFNFCLGPERMRDSTGILPAV